MLTLNIDPTPEAPKTSETPEGYEEPTAGGWDGYPIDELSIRAENRTAVDVVRRITSGKFVLDPDFQRGFVWTIEKQSRLIESILMRIPLPVFYVAEDEKGRSSVVDGRQRLTTLQRFLSGTLRLKLPDRPELDGKSFEELDSKYQNRVEDCQLQCYIIDHKVPERARLDIFERVNGGEQLTRQQMRNAIYNGPATVFLREASGTDLFREATGGSLNVGKMVDREFVNRFCAFSLLSLDHYKDDMDYWLAWALRELAAMSPDERDALRVRFDRALRNNLAVFGAHAFRKHKSSTQGRSVVNASLFDVMSTSLADRDEALVAARAEALRQAFYRRIEDPTFTRAITYGPNTPREVRTRFRMADEMMSEVFDAP